MGEMFRLTLDQMINLFLFILIGYALNKMKVLHEQTANVLGKLIFWVFMSSMSLQTFVNNMRPEQLADRLPYLILGTIIAVVSLGIALVLSPRFGRDKLEKAVYAYSFAFANIGFIGFPLCKAVFGEEMLCNLMVIGIPFSMLSFTWGVAIFSRSDKVSLKSLINPPNVAMAIGLVLGLCRVTLPNVLSGMLSSASNCMAPCAMILTGFVLAKGPIKKAFIQPKIYLASVIRLILIPALFLGAEMLIGVSKDIRIITALSTALPVGLNSIILSEANGLDSTVAAHVAVIANLMGIVTVPLACMLVASL